MSRSKPEVIIVPQQRYHDYYPDQVVIAPAAPFPQPTPSPSYVSSSGYPGYFTPTVGEPVIPHMAWTPEDRSSTNTALPTYDVEARSRNSRTSESRRVNQRFEAPPPTVDTGKGAGVGKELRQDWILAEERLKRDLERERRKRKGLERELQQEQKRREEVEAQLVETRSQLQQERKNSQPEKSSRLYETGVFESPHRLSVTNGARTKTAKSHAETPNSASSEEIEPKQASKPSLRQRIGLQRPPSSISKSSTSSEATVRPGAPSILSTAYTATSTKSSIPTLNLAPLLSKLSLTSRN
ncbi:hypothetical protein FA15DRAFT_670117 [Coprinopsis marcescibilis]|uniref:Uncharacterized protein n=1 Tax=Coprinopsis marcescibilis TaxID=230819 RepID=A0A5C3KVC9_COPMA|nr:hypothetical protein FA15DRAFT_670117 [Coprinopsis marcescibilis]